MFKILLFQVFHTKIPAAYWRKVRRNIQQTTLLLYRTLVLQTFLWNQNSFTMFEGFDFLRRISEPKAMILARN